MTLVQDVVTIPRKDSPRPNLIGLSRDAIAEILTGIGVSEKQIKMRVSQIWQWLYVKGAQDFAAMTNLSKDIRTQLADVADIARPEIVTRQVSEDGTRKYLLRIGGGMK